MTQKTRYRIYAVFVWTSASECFLPSFRATWGHMYCEREICSFKSTWSLLKTWSGAADRLPPDVWRQATLASSFPLAPSRKTTVWPVSSVSFTIVYSKYWRFRYSEEVCWIYSEWLHSLLFVHSLYTGFLRLKHCLRCFYFNSPFFWNLSETPKTNKKKLSISVGMTAGWISNLNTSRMTLWFLL